jgi:hypothetical protein
MPCLQSLVGRLVWQSIIVSVILGKEGTQSKPRLVTVSRDHTMGAAEDRQGYPLPPSPLGMPIAILDEFLVAEELKGLLAYALGNRPRFVRSEVTRSAGSNEYDNEQRRSRVLFDLGPYESVFRRRLLTFLPHVFQALARRPFAVSGLEIQLTATNHAEFFRAHTDSGDADLEARQLTFVYFFHREPRRFGGGELRIFDTTEKDGVATTAGYYRLVYPLQNQIVFFPSSYLHEILPVSCPSRQFADSRFTVNGWYRQ